MSKPNGKKLDFATTLVILMTAALFVLAVVVKGIGKDLLLEAGVLLVSIKLIMMSFKQAAEARAIREDLDRILELLKVRLQAGGQEPAQGGTEE